MNRRREARPFPPPRAAAAACHPAGCGGHHLLVEWISRNGHFRVPFCAPSDPRTTEDPATSVALVLLPRSPPRRSALAILPPRTKSSDGRARGTPSPPGFPRTEFRPPGRVSPVWHFPGAASARPAEAVGDLDARGLHVNLSDGGHLENLASYQMLKRRFRGIIAVDAEADPSHPPA